MVDQAALDGWRNEVDERSVEFILAWASARFRKLTMATAFGPEGCVLIDLVGRLRLPIEVFTLDTQVFFPQTYDLWRRIEETYGLHIRGVQPNAEELAEAHEMWRVDPHRCCALRKLQPLRRTLAGKDAWITAIRSDQTPDRADAKVVEWDERFGLIKINPLLGWTHDEVWAYLRRHDVPVNPLHAQGFASIGCQPCTSPVATGEDLRAGRWRGVEKTECGLHLRRGAPPLRRAPVVAGAQAGLEVGSHRNQESGDVGHGSSKEVRHAGAH